MKYVIRNGKIYDGTGSPGYFGDIFVESGKIKKIWKKEKPEEKIESNIDAQMIEAKGKIVAPGFIDIHRHCDLAALYDDNFGELEMAQGLTSVMGGNCGLGIFPSTKEHGEEIYDFVEPCLGIGKKETIISDYSQYRTMLKSKEMPLHVGCYQGLGAIKAAIKGYGKNAFTSQEMQQAKSYLKEAMEAGCLGITSGIMYQPECYSTKEEMTELLSAVSPYQRPLSCHIRGEGDNLVASVEEIIEICKKAQMPLNISHFKATGIKNWGKNIYEAIELIEKARRNGQDVSVDFYPYCGGSTTLISLVPPDIMEEDMSLTFRKMQTMKGKIELKDSLYKEHPGWDNMVTAIGWERILISSVTKEENRELVGLNFQEAAKKRGLDESAYLMADLLAEEFGKVGIIVLSMSQEDVDAVAKLPYSMVISDGLYGVSDCPHPRLYGSFPHFLQDYVVKRKIFTLEQALQKMTSMPAKRLGLVGRGVLKEGYFADVNIFSIENFQDHAVYGDSRKMCTGLSCMLVDGKLALKEGIRQKGYTATLLSK